MTCSPVPMGSEGLNQKDSVRSSGWRWAPVPRSRAVAPSNGNAEPATPGTYLSVPRRTATGLPWSLASASVPSKGRSSTSVPASGAAAAAGALAVPIPAATSAVVASTALSRRVSRSLPRVICSSASLSTRTSTRAAPRGQGVVRNTVIANTQLSEAARAAARKGAGPRGLRGGHSLGGGPPPLVARLGEHALETPARLAPPPEDRTEEEDRPGEEEELRPRDRPREGRGDDGVELGRCAVHRHHLGDRGDLDGHGEPRPHAVDDHGEGAGVAREDLVLLVVGEDADLRPTGSCGAVDEQPGVPLVDDVEGHAHGAGPEGVPRAAVRRPHVLDGCGRGELTGHPGGDAEADPALDADVRPVLGRLHGADRGGDACGMVARLRVRRHGDGEGHDLGLPRRDGDGVGHGDPRARRHRLLVGGQHVEATGARVETVRRGEGEGHLLLAEVPPGKVALDRLAGAERVLDGTATVGPGGVRRGRAPAVRRRLFGGGGRYGEAEVGERPERT